MSEPIDLERLREEMRGLKASLAEAERDTAEGVERMYALRMENERLREDLADLRAVEVRDGA